MFCAGITLLVSTSLLRPAHWLRDPCVSKCLWMENRSTASLFIKEQFRHLAWPKLATNWWQHQRTFTHLRSWLKAVWAVFIFITYVRWEVAIMHTHTGTLALKALLCGPTKILEHCQNHTTLLGYLISPWETGRIREIQVWWRDSKIKNSWLGHKLQPLD